MVNLQWSLSHGLLGLSTYLTHKLKGHKPVPTTSLYESKPLDVSDLFNNAATADFDGHGGHYPLELLPEGILTNENVKVSFRKYQNFHYTNGFD